jgi:acetoin:2,6-dichlorophenolindophenol oxidoreductase subunit beta
MARMRMNRAISTALADEMRADESVLLLGEDVGAAGGVFKTSEGLLEEFGPDRVRDTPIAEMGFLGLAVGVAAAGFRPVAEIMFAEFLGVAMDQVVTEAAKLRFLSRGEFGVPLVIRASAGPGLGFGAQHSQTLESWFTSTPGLKVVVASGADSAYGLLRAAIRDDDPVLFFEPRALYGEREEVDTDPAHLPAIGRVRRLREGSALTVLGLGQTVPVARAAVAAADLDADVLDLATVVPWDVPGVLESVRRTGRLVTVEANPYTGGWGAMVAAEIGSRAFGDLKAPVARITCPDVPVPYAKNLEAAYVPSADYVADQLTKIITSGRTPAPWWEEASAHA